MRSRIIASLVVKNKIVVQSFGFQKYLPVGNVKICCENLDNWDVDEINIVCIDRSVNNLGPDLELVENVSSLGISTPITYSGGIRNVKDAEMVIAKGADRICVNSLLMKNSIILKDIAYSIGSQSLLMNLNIKKKGSNFYLYNYINKKIVPIDSISLDLINFASELIITDVDNEGSDNDFNLDILEIVKKKFSKKKLIFFGGITKKNKIDSIKKKNKNASFMIGNFFSYKELANWYFK